MEEEAPDHPESLALMDHARPHPRPGDISEDPALSQGLGESGGGLVGETMDFDQPGPQPSSQPADEGNDSDDGDAAMLGLILTIS